MVLSPGWGVRHISLLDNGKVSSFTMSYSNFIIMIIMVMIAIIIIIIAIIIIIIVIIR